MTRKLLLFIVLLPIIGYGQQNALTSHFYENIMLFNPSIVGFDQNTSIRLNARQQWYNFTEANIGQSSLSINRGFNDDGVGVTVFTDNSGNISKSGLNISYSRRVIMDNESVLYFGLNGGFQNNQIGNVSVLDFEFIDNKYNWSPSTTFGLTYVKKSLLVGFSVDGLLESDLDFTNSQNILEKHYYGFISYSNNISEEIALKPSILYREAESGYSQFDMNLNLSYKNSLTLGFGYRGNFTSDSDFGPMVTLGFNLGNIKSLISQDFVTNEVSSYSSGTTEFTLSYTAEPKKKEELNDESNEEEEEEEFIDSDNDGVSDDDDECPNEFGSKSANGCPDFDNDGVRDSQDKCPNTIGDIMNNGCPVLSKRDSAIVVDAMRNIEFDTNSSQIKSSSFMYLKNIGKLLLGNRNMLLIINGHTDSDASDDYNYTLSAKRAKSVKSYIENMGVSSSRLIIDFYGESMPLAPNNNELNKQKNRRVEFGVTFI